jgi:hypothetical protein
MQNERDIDKRFDRLLHAMATQPEPSEKGCKRQWNVRSGDWRRL